MRLSESQLQALSKRVPGRLWPYAVVCLMWVTSESGKGEHRRGILLGGRELRARDFAAALLRAESTCKKRLAELTECGFLHRERGQHGYKMWVRGLRKFEDTPESDVQTMGGPSEGGAETDTRRGVHLRGPDESPTGGPSESGDADETQAMQDPSEALERVFASAARPLKEEIEQKRPEVKLPLRNSRPGFAGRPPLAAETAPTVRRTAHFTHVTDLGKENGQPLTREQAAALDDYPGTDRCGLTYEQWFQERKKHLRRQAEALGPRAEVRSPVGTAASGTAEQE